MKWREGGQFENPPVGSHIARCFALIDLGSHSHRNPKTGETWIQRDVRIMFELPLELMEGKYDEKLKGKPFAVIANVKQSLHPQAALRKLLEGWRGKKFDQTSIEQFEPKSIVGLPCRLNLVENGNFINIQSISRLGKNETCPPAINKPVYFSLEEGEFDQKVLEGLTEKTKATIKASPEYFNLTGQQPESQEEAPASHVEGDGPPTSDDVPF